MGKWPAGLAGLLLRQKGEEPERGSLPVRT